MHVDPIPMKLSPAETWAAALLTAADELAAAADLPEFITAINTNHRLWRMLMEMVPFDGWDMLTRHDADFAVTKTCDHGIGVNDGDVTALVEINQRAARGLVPGHHAPAMAHH